MTDNSGRQRLLGCCYMLLFVVAVLSILVYGCYRSEIERMADLDQRTDKMRQELFEKVKHGNSTPWVLDAELLSMLADDPDCVRNVTSLQFSMSDLSDSRFRRTREFHQLRGINFYDCRNTDNVLEAVNGMPTIITVYFEVSVVTEDGIRLLATLPNLKKVQFEQIMPPSEVGLLRKLLPNVELVYWSRTGGKEQLIHDNPASNGEPE